VVCVAAVHGAGQRGDVDWKDADSSDENLRRQSQRQAERRHVTDYLSFRRRRRSQGQSASIHVIANDSLILLRLLHQSVAI